ncbi:hypothetical protein [Streptomyces sp. NPDC058240]|uniref:hypothetical protein n=1 Tax=Streptomyces sp. NPDC058240 TaxID=3346396 RepID=UPI0036F133CC
MTTKHSHKPNFGKKVDGCPRCDELKAGAEPVTWNVRHEARLDEEGRRSISAHFAANGPHVRGECGPVCTFGDW